MADRTPGKLGCLPGVMPVGLGMLTDYVAGNLPTAPEKVVPPSVAEWGMLGNDTYGDCGVAGIVHGFMADAAIAQERETFPDTDQTVRYYLDFTHGQDSGVVLTDFLRYVRSHPLAGHTVDSFAPVAVQDMRTLHTAVWMYGFAYCGIRVTAAMQQRFAVHKPWKIGDLDSPVVGGHCVPIVGYDDFNFYVVTWGGVQAITYGVWPYIATEAHAVLTGEFVARNGDGRGVNLKALRADLDRLVA